MGLPHFRWWATVLISLEVAFHRDGAPMTTVSSTEPAAYGRCLCSCEEEEHRPTSPLVRWSAAVEQHFLSLGATFVLRSLKMPRRMWAAHVFAVLNMWKQWRITFWGSLVKRYVLALRGSSFFSTERRAARAFQQIEKCDFEMV